jgi:hypothetical protein
LGESTRTALLDTCITAAEAGLMAVLDEQRTSPKLPHPRWRVPFLGDVFSYDADSPSQSAIETRPGLARSSS